MTLSFGAVAPTSGSAESIVAAARRAERVGYRDLMWSDHLMGLAEAIWTTDITPAATHVGSPNVFFDVVPAMAIAGTATSRIRVGTCVTDAIRRHPAVLAHQWLTLDHLTGGRVVLGIGAGEAENLLPYGMPHDHPVARLEEALEIVRLLWTADEPVDLDGTFWPLRRALCALAPFRPGRPPPIWVGGVGPRSLAVTGRLADGWIPVALTPDDYAAGRSRVTDAAVAAGRDPATFTWSSVQVLLVHEDPRRCEELLETKVLRSFVLNRSDEFFTAHGIEHPLGRGHRGVVDHVPTWLTDDENRRAIEAIPHDLVRAVIIAGTPDEVSRHLRAHAAAGVDHVVVFDAMGLCDPTGMPESTRLLDEIIASMRSQ